MLPIVDVPILASCCEADLLEPFPGHRSSSPVLVSADSLLCRVSRFVAPLVRALTWLIEGRLMSVSWYVWALMASSQEHHCSYLLFLSADSLLYLAEVVAPSDSSLMMDLVGFGQSKA